MNDPQRYHATRALTLQQALDHPALRLQLLLCHFDGLLELDALSLCDEALFVLQGQCRCYVAMPRIELRPEFLELLR